MIAQQRRLSGSLGTSGVRRHPATVLPKDSMSIEATQGLQDGPTADASATNRRVTARVVREGHGSPRTIYTVDGHDVGSLEALQTVLGGQR